MATNDDPSERFSNAGSSKFSKQLINLPHPIGDSHFQGARHDSSNSDFQAPPLSPMVIEEEVTETEGSPRKKPSGLAEEFLKEVQIDL